MNCNLELMFNLRQSNVSATATRRVVPIKEDENEDEDD